MLLYMIDIYRCVYYIQFTLQMKYNHTFQLFSTETIIYYIYICLTSFCPLWKLILLLVSALPALAQHRGAQQRDAQPRERHEGSQRHRGQTSRRSPSPSHTLYKPMLKCVEEKNCFSISLYANPVHESVQTMHLNNCA